MNKRAVGTTYEQIAGEYLESKGARIIERNYRCRHGEIDLILLDGEILVFVEVKYRKNRNYGYPEEAVSKNKRRKIVLVSGYYRMQKHYGDNVPVRFDVVSILGDTIHWVKNAFSYDDI